MHLRLAAYAIIVDPEDRMLLAHWVEGDRAAWTLPGGGVEAGEDPFDTVHREVMEETGYEIEVDGLLGIDSKVIPAARRLHDATTDLHAVRIVYRAHITGGRLRNEIDGTTDEAAWIALQDVAELTHADLVDAGLKLAGIR